MTNLNNIIGLEIVGFRYGIAPENGYSYNTQEHEYECGVSMAQVGYDREINSFAIDAQTSKKYYYIGNVAGLGSDNEICLTNIRQITRNEYLNYRRKMIEASNAIVNYNADRKLRLAYKGYHGYNEQEIENYRNKYIK